MTDKQLLLITVPNQATGERIAAALLDARLVACVQLLPGLLSLYEWEGKRQREPEVLMLAKTSTRLFPVVQEKILSLHPYQVPQIVAVPIEVGFHRYLQWIDDVTVAKVAGDSAVSEGATNGGEPVR